MTIPTHELDPKAIPKGGRPRWSLILITALCGAHASEFHVSPLGDDANPGTRAQPFKTLEAARDAVREVRGMHVEGGGATVWLEEGIHVLDRTFELDARDSGTSEAPVVYRAVEKGRVSVMGGIPIDPTAFKPVVAEAVLNRLPESARGKVIYHKLPEPAAAIVRNESGRTAHSLQDPVPELFFNDAALPFSRWPNEGWAIYGEVVDSGSVPLRACASS